MMLTEAQQDEIARGLVARARAEGAELVGPDGVLSGLTKRVLETALEEELTHHLGYGPYDPAGHHFRELPQRGTGEDCADRGRPCPSRCSTGPGRDVRAGDRISDRVIEEMTEWLHRPLDEGRFLSVVANPDWKGFRCRIARGTRPHHRSSVAISS
jgi:hypothetical protein